MRGFLRIHYTLVHGGPACTAALLSFVRSRNLFEYEIQRRQKKEKKGRFARTRARRRGRHTLPRWRWDEDAASWLKVKSSVERTCIIVVIICYARLRRRTWNRDYSSCAPEQTVRCARARPDITARRPSTTKNSRRRLWFRSCWLARSTKLHAKIVIIYPWTGLIP